MARSLVVSRLISAVELNIHEQGTLVVSSMSLGLARMNAGNAARKIISRFDDLRFEVEATDRVSDGDAKENVSDQSQDRATFLSRSYFYFHCNAPVTCYLTILFLATLVLSYLARHDENSVFDLINW